MNADPDAMPENNPQDGPPPLSDEGIKQFRLLIDDIQTGNLSDAAIRAKIGYFGPRILKRLDEHAAPAEPGVTFVSGQPPPWAHSLDQPMMPDPNIAAVHALIGQEVTICWIDRSDVEENLPCKITDVGQVFLDTIDDIGRRRFIPISAVGSIEMSEPIASANPSDYME